MPTVHPALAAAAGLVQATGKTKKFYQKVCWFSAGQLHPNTFKRKKSIRQPADSPTFV